MSAASIQVFWNVSNLWFVKRSNVPDRPVTILPSRRWSARRWGRRLWTCARSVSIPSKLATRSSPFFLFRFHNSPLLADPVPSMPCLAPPRLSPPMSSRLALQVPNDLFGFFYFWSFCLHCCSPWPGIQPALCVERGSEELSRSYWSSPSTCRWSWWLIRSLRLANSLLPSFWSTKSDLLTWLIVIDPDVLFIVIQTKELVKM